MTLPPSSSICFETFDSSGSTARVSDGLNPTDAAAAFFRRLTTFFRGGTRAPFGERSEAFHVAERVRDQRRVDRQPVLVRVPMFVRLRREVDADGFSVADVVIGVPDVDGHIHGAALSPRQRDDAHL